MKAYTTDIVTEVCEKYFPFTRTSLLSFLNHNSWFSGKIYLIQEMSNPISARQKTELSLIYHNIELIDFNLYELFPKFKQEKSTQISTRLSYLKFAIFKKFKEKILYFSNFSLFFNDVSGMVLPGKTVGCNDSSHIFYIDHFSENSIDSFLDTLTSFSFNVNLEFRKVIAGFPNYIEISAETYYSSFFSDKKYASIGSKLAKLDHIVYDTFTSSKNNKINAVWLNANQSLLSKLKSTSHVKRSILSKATVSSLEKKKCLKIISDAKRIETRPIYSLKESELLRSISEFEKIEKYSDSPAIQGYSTACVIAFKDRHPIVELNVKLLNEQSLPPAIVLVSSNLQDADFVERLMAKYKNVFAVHHPNYPIGGKWSAGVKFCKKLGVHGVMILGSDDLLSLDYFKACYESIDEGFGSSRNGVDLIGNRQWFIHTTSRKTYFLEYLPCVSIFLGGGKMFSKNFLDAVDWNIFKEFRPFHLDEYGYELVEKFSNSFAIIDPEHFIFSVKGKWEVINSADSILKAPSRISVKDVTLTTEKILTKLKLQNNATFESILS